MSIRRPITIPVQPIKPGIPSISRAVFLLYSRNLFHLFVRANLNARNADRTRLGVLSALNRGRPTETEGSHLPGLHDNLEAQLPRNLASVEVSGHRADSAAVDLYEIRPVDGDRTASGWKAFERAGVSALHKPLHGDHAAARHESACPNEGQIRKGFPKPFGVGDDRLARKGRRQRIRISPAFGKHGGDAGAIVIIPGLDVRVGQIQCICHWLLLPTARRIIHLIGWEGEIAAQVVGPCQIY